MRRLVAIWALVLATPVLAVAHVSVRPRESRPNMEERYTVRVPTEGAVATTQVVLEIPVGVMVLEVLSNEGATFETTRQGDRITAITWKKDIPPKESAQFVFRARNPASGDLVWKAHQHFSDGTTADWVGMAGEKRPASLTKLAAAASAGAAQTADTEAAGIETWLKGYDAAFNAKDLDKLATFYHPDATVVEGAGINNGWADYRDHHLGPELKAFEDLQFAHTNTKVHMLGERSAYVTSQYTIRAKMKDRELDSEGRETLVLMRMPDNTWKIRHSHTSGRPRRR